MKILCSVACRWFALLALLIGTPFHEIATAQTGIQYDVVIQGVSESSLVKDLQSVSDTYGLKEKFPPTMQLLRYRAEKDTEKFTKVLRAQGYYGEKTRVAIDDKSQPVQVVFKVEPGPRYTFKTISTNVKDKSKDLALPSPAELGLISGEPAMARAVIDAQGTLLGRIKDQGYPFPKIQEQRVVVDHRTRHVDVTFDVDPGPPARFGATQFSGLQSVNEEVLSRKLPWNKGDKFNASLLPKLRNNLTDTKLFSIVRIDYAEELDKDGLLPIAVEVTERKHRSVRAGAAWSSDEGFGGKVTWEHRNLFHNGERLYLGIVASQINQALEGIFERPYFFRDDQSLAVNFAISNETTDAYDSQNIGSALLINRKIREKMELGAGLGFRASKVKQQGETEEFTLFYLPAHFAWDTSDSLLDPTRGGKLNVRLAPYFDATGSGSSFTKGFLVYSHYFQLFDSPFVLFAGRAAIGSIVGAGRSGIPADLRFYAGGGGSIRGYAYQKVGPLDGDTPLGGRSLLELSAELRFKITETMGFVTFLDGGTAFDATYPNFDETIRWGAGPGFRYYTPIGPLRLDVGFPLNKRPGIDSNYQIYVSIGQAF
ncbi:autotransporter assembly complex protein TamA [Desulfoferrobacter suflitae]|uniref:autotransporter assembly complex protein TamA n=1 Tax=Desulfoferrobacter suflitae TaxID=2865782 RepID=UPI002164580E|nr:autotransporter assembly complex family protein [Desulfoferrobacter suflitae]MCK8602255.1 autotransporter assembly complex protein TamA [Desulfoferrobacter suflitae]